MKDRIIAVEMMLAKGIFIPLMLIAAFVFLRVKPGWIEPALQGASSASGINILVCLFLWPVLAIVRPLRPLVGMGLIVSSYTFGALLWLLGLTLTYAHWGGLAVVIGLVPGAIGVIPLAMIASMVAGQWQEFGGLILLLVMVWGCRAIAFTLIGSYERSKERDPETDAGSQPGASSVDDETDVDFERMLVEVAAQPRANKHVYEFTYRELPAMLAADPNRFVQELLAGRAMNLLRAAWETVNQSAERNGLRRREMPDGVTIRTERTRFGDVFYLLFPTPQAMTEPFCIAVTAPARIDDIPAYYVLERSLATSEGVGAAISCLAGDLRMNLGVMAEPSFDEFHAIIVKHAEAVMDDANRETA